MAKNSQSIDCSTIHGDELKNKINELLDKVVDKKLETIHLSHIVSSDFIEMYDLDEPDDVNGWQCDWWGYMYHNRTKINIFGEAFYGNVELSLYDD